MTLAQYQLLSSKMISPYPASPSDPSADSICNDYARALMAKKDLLLSIKEFTSDHIVVGSYYDFLNIPKPSDSQKYLFSTAESSTLGISDYDHYFVKQGTATDITASFLKTYSDSSYTSDSSQPNEASLDLNAGLKELTIQDSRCGLKYIIDIANIGTNGGTAVLHGQIADSSVNIPSASDQNSDNLSAPKCSDLQAMIEGVSAQGIEIAGMSNLCTDDQCHGDVYNLLRIGKPSQNTNDGSMDSVMLSFQSSNHSMRR